MKTISIACETGTSSILVGESLDNLATHIRGKRSILITDTSINRLYGKRFPHQDVIEIGTGEKIKTLATAEKIFLELVDREIDRSAFIVGIGGGIVCDITGFIASTFMRGLDFGFVSTSLLSQVDAAVGGKNGVNFHGYKNLVGVFNQPRFVICDHSMLKTLSDKEFLCGLGEIIKHAAIKSFDIFQFLEKNYKAVLRQDEAVLEQMIYQSINVKADVVRQDEREKGERKKLNFGHTLGHAVEKVIGLPHGEAVAVGMVFALKLSVKRNLLAQENADRVIALIQNTGLPTSISMPKEKILDALRRDKKREGRGVHFVLLKAIGEAVVVEIPINQLEEAIHDMC
ncbi:MAG: 3-dehydroquinate synthase [bacterium]|nr:3-dehydroquinate synthase [bacterium]